MEAKVHHALPPPFRQDLHDEAFANTLSRCEVSVHILSQYPGRVFEGPDNTYICIHQASKSFINTQRKVFWVPKNLRLDSIDEDHYKDFLEQLDFGIEDDQYVLLKGDPQTLDADITRVINFPQKKSLNEGILIVHHGVDEDAALKLKDRARKNKIACQYNSSSDDDPTASLKILTDQLRDLQRVIIVIGKVKKDWAVERAKHIVSTIIQNDFEVDSIGFYFTKESAETFPFKDRGFTIITVDENNDESIDKFF